MKQAAEKAKSLDPKKVAEAMHSGMTFDTVIGPISYDKKGDRTTRRLRLVHLEERSRRQDQLRAERLLIRSPRGGSALSGRTLRMNGKPALSGGFLFAHSPDLAELRKRLDQPQRNALKAAGQKQNAGRDEQDADGLLDPAELRAQMARGADERADRGGGEQ